MKNMGNISGRVFTSNPPSWDELHVCDDCKLKKTVQVVAEGYVKDYSDYTELPPS
jgi:hypothetical protein